MQEERNGERVCVCLRVRIWLHTGDELGKTVAHTRTHTHRELSAWLPREGRHEVSVCEGAFECVCVAVSVCMRVYVCVHTYIYTYTHTYISRP
jgi:hypothetical protein